MTFRFPEVDDIRLEKPPLNKVICQVKFPTILKIVEKTPSDFQEIVRNKFPKFESQVGVSIKISAEGFETQAPQPSEKSYRFLSKDGNEQVTLRSDFYALTDENYTSWKSFYDNLELVHKAVIESYQIPFATRIGLRFINEFSYKNTDLETVESLVGIFNPELISLMKTECWDNPEELITNITIRDNDDSMKLRIGFKTEPEPSMLLDIDVYTNEELEEFDILGRLMLYHDYIYRAFRWSIKQEGLKNFQPLRE